MPAYGNRTARLGIVSVFAPRDAAASANQLLQGSQQSGIGVGRKRYPNGCL